MPKLSFSSWKHTQAANVSPATGMFSAWGVTANVSRECHNACILCQVPLSRLESFHDLLKIGERFKTFGRGALADTFNHVPLPKGQPGIQKNVIAVLREANCQFPTHA